MLGIVWRSLPTKSQSAVKSGNMSCDCSDACTTVEVCSSSSCVVADVYLLLLLRAWLPQPCHSCTWCLFITLMRGNAYCVVTLDRAVHFLRSFNISVHVSARRCSWERHRLYLKDEHRLQVQTCILADDQQGVVHSVEVYVETAFFFIDINLTGNVFIFEF